MCAKSLQSSLTLCDPVDCSLSGSLTLCPQVSPGKNTGWVSISFSRKSFQPRDRTWVSYISCTGRGVLTTSATWEAPVAVSNLGICYFSFLIKSKTFTFSLKVRTSRRWQILMASITALCFGTIIKKN